MPQARTIATSHTAETREFNRDFQAHLSREHENNFMGIIRNSPIYKGKEEVGGGFVVKKGCTRIVTPAGVLITHHPPSGAKAFLNASHPKAKSPIGDNSRSHAPHWKLRGARWPFLEVEFQ
jgi:hypothetical protein